MIWTPSSQENFPEDTTLRRGKALGDGFRKANGSGLTAGAYETHFSNAGNLESLGIYLPKPNAR